MTVYFENQTDYEFDFDYKEIANKVINQTLMHENFNHDVEVSITFADEENIREINKEFRGIDNSTDVLSFPMIEYETVFSRISDRKEEMYDFVNENLELLNPDTDEIILGDIVLCIPIIIMQAKEYNHSILREYAFLIVHSMLHLLGFDHIEEDERIIMENKQKEILDSLSITRDL